MFKYFHKLLYVFSEIIQESYRNSNRIVISEISIKMNT